jgi:hypothetical protein
VEKEKGIKIQRKIFGSFGKIHTKKYPPKYVIPKMPPKKYHHKVRRVITW